MDFISGTINQNYNPIYGFQLTEGLFMIILLAMLFFLFLFYSLGSSNNSSDISTSSGNSTFGTLSRIILIIIFFIFLFNLIEVIFNIDITTTVSNLFTNDSTIDININRTIVDEPETEQPVPEIMSEKQVFNIPQNSYTYDDAKALCKAYDANLATYQQIEEAYKNGGEWCSYGWSENQLALFPTQQKTYDTLQCIPGHEHDCGRPGINGGYIANPYVKFGVNCYGYKPEITSKEAEMMRYTSPYPKTQKDIDFQNKVDYWKSKLTNINVSPFNKKNWSE